MPSPQCSRHSLVVVVGAGTECRVITRRSDGSDTLTIRAKDRYAHSPKQYYTKSIMNGLYIYTKSATIGGAANPINQQQGWKVGQPLWFSEVIAALIFSLNKPIPKCYSGSMKTIGRGADTTGAIISLSLTFQPITSYRLRFFSKNHKFFNFIFELRGMTRSNPRRRFACNVTMAGFPHDVNGDLDTKAF